MRTGLNAWLGLRPEGGFLARSSRWSNRCTYSFSGVWSFLAVTLCWPDRRFRPADVGPGGRRRGEREKRPDPFWSGNWWGRADGLTYWSAQRSSHSDRRLDPGLRLRPLPQIEAVRLEGVVAALCRVGRHCGASWSFVARGPPLTHPLSILPAAVLSVTWAGDEALATTHRRLAHHRHLAPLLRSWIAVYEVSSAG